MVKNQIGQRCDVSTVCLDMESKIMGDRWTDGTHGTE